MIELGHVNIRTALFDQTIEFYSSILGLRSGVAETKPGPDNLWLFDDSGKPSVHLERAEQSASPDGMINHIAFDCDHIDRWQSRLDRLGIGYRLVAHPAAKIVQLKLIDPNGIHLELCFRH